MTDRQEPLFELARRLLATDSFAFFPDEVQRIVKAVADSAIVSVDGGSIFTQPSAHVFERLRAGEHVETCDA